MRWPFFDWTTADAARLVAIVVFLVGATAIFESACGGGTTPVCGPDAGCGPGPFSEVGPPSDGGVE
jgi:hypothetical protein